MSHHAYMRGVAVITQQAHARTIHDMAKKELKKTEAARLLGRLGGKAGSTAQNDARRINARKGGRPPRKQQQQIVTAAEWEKNHPVGLGLEL